MKGVLMKRLLKLSLVSLIAFGAVADCDHGYTSKSFFSNINPYQLSFPSRISFFRSDRMYAKDCGWGSAFQAVGFWSQTSASDDLARYFFPFNKTSLVAGEYYASATQSRTNDLLANYFGVFTNNVTNGSGVPTDLTFQSTISMCPKSKTYGVGLTWSQRLFNCFWADVSTSIVQVQNELNFKEKVSNYGADNVPDGSYGTMSAALSSNRAHYGRFTNNTMKKSGVADVELRLGMEKDICDCCGVGGIYAGVVIPTGNKPGKTDSSATTVGSSSKTAMNTMEPCDWGRYIFQPIVGNNHHWGVIIGSYGRLEVFHSNDGCPLTLMTDCTGKYLFSNCQKRSFDPYDKMWGRYIHVLTDSTADPASVSLTDFKPLINYSTLNANVTPGWSIDWNTALHYQLNCWGFEAGMNVYAREMEKVSINQNLQNGLGFADLYSWADDIGLYTNSLETIQNDGWGNQTDTDANGNDVYVVINKGDLDPFSAAAPSVLNSTFYGALSFEWDNCKVPTFFSGGGSYTFTSDNGAADCWTAWIKIGLSF